MSSEKISIDDQTFLVNRLIDQCPKSMMLREFVQNAIEAAQNDVSGQGRVVIKTKLLPDIFGDVEKLCIWNNGPGMTAADLKKMAKLSTALHKTKGLDGNFGIGAKVAGLPSNKLGLYYRSCTIRPNKDGFSTPKVHELILWRDEDGDYSVFKREMDDESWDTVCDVTDEYDASELRHEWTEVVLAGNEVSQNTSRTPVIGEIHKKEWIPAYLYERYFRIPKNVEISIHKECSTNDSTRKLKTAVDLFDKFDNYEEIITDNGIIIHYWHDPRRSDNGTTKLSTHVAHNLNNMIGVVHKGEIYDMRNLQAWTSIAPQFGITHKQRNFSVIIELPDDYDVGPEGYREAIRYNHGLNPRVQVTDFARIVFENRPQWLKDLLDSYRQKEPTDLSELEKELKDLIARALFKVKNLLSSKDGVTPVKPGTGPGRVVVRGEGPVEPAPHPKPTKTRPYSPVMDSEKKASSINHDDIPPFWDFLYEPDRIEENCITGKAAKYVEGVDGQINTLYINMLYPAALEIQAELEAHYAHYPDAEEMKALVSEQTRFIMASKTSYAVVNAKLKRRLKEWTEEDQQRASSPECLSIAADNWFDSLQDVKRKLSHKLSANKSAA